MTIIDGFVSVEQYEQNHGRLNQILFPTTGFFVMEQVNGNPKLESLGLYDEFSHIKYSMNQVSFLREKNNALESKKIMPRPFVVQKADDQRISVVMPGDKVKISYIGGSLYNPLVEGSIESLQVVEQVPFLKLDPQNLDRIPQRLENKEFILEWEIDGHGGLTLTLTGKDGSGKTVKGTGNINIKISGSDNTQGQVNLTTNGPIDLKQIDSKGNVLNEVTMSPTADVAVAVTDLYKNQVQMGKNGVQVQGQRTQSLEHSVYGETLRQKLSDLIDQIKALTVPTGTGPSGVPNNSAAFGAIQDGLDDILVE